MSETKTNRKPRPFPELRIKIKSLADEAKTIRAEEKKFTGDRRNQLHNHRVCEVRTAARSSLLAYGFLRRRPYKKIEPTACWKRESLPTNRALRQPDWTDIARMVRKYGGEDFKGKTNNELMVAWLPTWYNAP